MEKSENSLVPAQSPNDQLESWGFGQLTGRYFTSLDRNKPDVMAQLFKLLNATGIPIDDYINKPIVIVGYLLTPATFADEKTGEEITTLVSKLLLDDDTIIETHSKGVCKSLMIAGEMLGLPSVSKPYRGKLCRRSLRGNKSWVVLELDT